jgi:hypothetical protein
MQFDIKHINVQNHIKVKKIIVAFIALSCILVSCGTPSDEAKPDHIEKIEQKNPKDENLSMLKREASRLRAGGSIKVVELEGRSAEIVYVKDYEEYKELNPQSGLSESELEGYWESGDAIEKALVDGSVRIMKKLDYIDIVSIILPFKGATYSISVAKTELEKFVGSDFSTIQNKWDDTFSNPYVYDDKGRKMFFDKFGKKE